MFSALISVEIGLREMSVIVFSVGAEYGSGVDDPPGDVYLKARPNQQGVGKQANSAAVAVAERMNPNETVVRLGYFHQIELWGIFVIDEL